MLRLDSIKSHIKKIGIYQTFTYLLQRLILRKGSLIKIKVPGLVNSIFLRNKYYDTHIFHQIFIREEVSFEYNKPPDIIVDCGANIGLSTLFFQRQFPNAVIISIEPELSNYHLLQRNIKKYKNIKILHAAVWYKNCFLKIIDTGGGVASFITSEAEKPDNSIEEINAYNISEIMKMFDLEYIDLIKIDIEGSEYEIFKNDSDIWIEKTKIVAVEIHESLKPGATKLIHSTLQDKFEMSTLGEYSVFHKNQYL